MRKYIFVLLALIAVSLFSLETVAQNSKRPPLPDWIFEKPQRSNTTFYYHVEKGVGETEIDARNAAYTQAFMQVALKLGIPLNTEDISEAVASGTNVKMLSQRFTIPMNVACYTSRRDEETGGWNYWLLCQIPEIGYADRVRFDDFNDCFKFDKYNEFKEKREAEKERQKQDSLRVIRDRNTTAIVSSAFIPGMGQMLKGQYGSGAAFLVSELALFGGGTACYFLGAEQAKIMKTSKDYNEYTNAKKMKNTLDIAMYTCFGVGAAVHIANMVHAWYVRDKKATANVAFAPAIIPTNEYSNPSYAMGAGVQIKF